MDKKNVGATVTIILCALLFIVIGSTFSAFVYKRELIEVENPKILIANGSDIKVFNSDGDKELDKLKLSVLKLGLKPTTGEEDSETDIPMTVTDKQGSEGEYAKFKLLAPTGAKIVITNIKIESKQEPEDVEKERENIMVAIRGIDGSTKSLKEDSVELGSVEASQEKTEYTFFIWLSPKTSDKLEASKISFDLSFVSLS